MASKIGRKREKKRKEGHNREKERKKKGATRRHEDFLEGAERCMDGSRPDT